MKVILLKDVKGHGAKDAVVEVSDGFARNYLIPNKLAKEGSQANLNEHKQKIDKEARLLAIERAEAQKVYDHLKTVTVDVAVKCGDGKMYGSVTAADISDALAKIGINIDKKRITIKEPIKKLGLFEVDVWVYKEMKTSVQINVVKGD
jgi:large subunit ribosomal protein L9